MKVIVSQEDIKKAFQESIKRWEMIVEDSDYYGKSNCSLCALGHDSYRCNSYCPIRNYEGKDHSVCSDTPYHAFAFDKTRENALAELNFLREVYISWIEKEDEKPKARIAIKPVWTEVDDFADFSIMRSQDVPGAFCFRRNGNILFWATIEIVERKNKGTHDAKIVDGIMYTKER